MTEITDDSAFLQDGLPWHPDAVPPGCAFHHTWMLHDAATIDCEALCFEEE
jgi:hypothetical protein